MIKSDLRIALIAAILGTLLAILIVDEVVDHWPEPPDETRCNCPCSTGGVRTLSNEVGYLGRNAPRQAQVRTDI